MEDLFDQVNRGVPGELNTGGIGKLCFIVSNHSSFKDFVVRENEPLTSLIANLFGKIIFKFRIRLAGSHEHIDELIEEHQFTREQAQETFVRETNELGVQLYLLMESTLKDSLGKDWPNNAPGWHDYVSPQPKHEKAVKHPISPESNIQPNKVVKTAFSNDLDGSLLLAPRKKEVA